MIPTDWTPYRRDDDDELLGYLVPVAGGLAEPTTIFGYRLADACDPLDAERTLDSVGLGYLADRWALALDGRDEPVTVQIVEASPERLVVQSIDYSFEGDYGTRFELDVPDTGRLRRA